MTRQILCRRCIDTTTAILHRSLCDSAGNDARRGCVALQQDVRQARFPRHFELTEGERAKVCPGVCSRSLVCDFCNAPLVQYEIAFAVSFMGRGQTHVPWEYGEADLSYLIPYDVVESGGAGG